VKTVSHGLLVLHEAAELLVGHATGSRWWDIPKGAAEEGESSAQAAVREALEEFGLQIDPGGLLPLGRFSYRPDKDLELHAVLSSRVETRSLACSSLFRDRFGRMRPEMDAFAWIAFDRLGDFCAKRMTVVLTERLLLPDVLGRLTRHPTPARIGPRR
jgi:8-oxo-dGTP pyrophosphatase MutT (NUDIX family)